MLVEDLEEQLRAGLGERHIASPRPIITSTSNIISHRQERTEPYCTRPCRRDVKSSPQREPDVPSDLLRALSGNVTESDSAFQQQILNVTEAQGEPEIEPNRQLDNLGREAAAAIGDLGHHQ